MCSAADVTLCAVSRPLPLLLLLLLAAGCPAPLIDDVEVVNNPANLLSRTVRWTTAEPTTSRIEFGEGDTLTFFVQDEDEVTDHELLVFGLHPESSYTLRIVAGDDHTDTSCDTEALPFSPVEAEVRVLDDALAEPGWTLCNHVVDESLTEVIAVMIDLDGRPVWYHTLGPVEGGGDVEVSLVDGDKVLIGGSLPPGRGPLLVDLAGEVLWEGPPQPDGLYTAGAMHHAFRRLDSGNYLGLYYDFVDGTVVDVIQEITPDGDVAWSWHAAEGLGDQGADYLHGNAAVEIDGIIAYNSRAASQLYAIDHTTDEWLWTFGEDGDYAYDGQHDWPWPSKAHAPEFLPDDRLLLYDNGSTTGRDFSRVVEYALDHDAMTATIAWEYPDAAVDDDWFNFAWGDADRLDNGNTLVTCGGMTSYDSPNRIFEVTPDGEVAWEVQLGTSGEKERAGAYAAERIPVLVGELE